MVRRDIRRHGCRFDRRRKKKNLDTSTGKSFPERKISRDDNKGSSVPIERRVSFRGPCSLIGFPSEVTRGHSFS